MIKKHCNDMTLIKDWLTQLSDKYSSTCEHCSANYFLSHHHKICFENLSVLIIITIIIIPHAVKIMIDQHEDLDSWIYHGHILNPCSVITCIAMHHSI